MKRGRLWFASAALAAAISGVGSALLGDCGPFTDVFAFCGPILELYYLGVANGSSPTTFDPNRPATRAEVAAFVARSFDQSIKRSNLRAALGQWWLPTLDMNPSISFGVLAGMPQSDGADVWVPVFDGTVARVRGSDMRILETWTGLPNPSAVLVAMGRVFVTNYTDPGTLSMIDPSQPPGTAATVATGLGSFPSAIAFDGSRIWVVNSAKDPSSGSVSIVTPGPSIPWNVQNVTGFIAPVGILYDGASIWVSQLAPPGLLKLDSTGSVVATAHLGGGAVSVYDGANIWVPGGSGATVIRPSTGQVIGDVDAHVSSGAWVAAFDGENILIVGQNPGLSDGALVRASDFTFIRHVSFPGGAGYGACSDGHYFWVTAGATLFRL